MKWVDWNYMDGITGPLEPVIRDVHKRCVEMDVDKIMGFQGHFNEEIVAQFYATLWIDQARDEMHWTTCGKRFSVTLFEFVGLFDLAEETAYAHTRNDHSKVDLHQGLELDETKMLFMYDAHYGDVQIGKYHGLSPFYKLLNHLLRGTLYPRGGDADNISKRAKNLLYQMAPGKPKFKVFNFIWNEIIYCSHDATSGCHYAPYIFHMIKNVCGVNILADQVHTPYHSAPGKIAQLLKLRNKAYEPVQAPPSSHGASSSRAPQAPSTSHVPLSSSGTGKKGKLDSILQGVFACFNMCKQNSQDIRDTRQFLDEEMLKFERRQKEIMTKVDLPHSPIREPREFPPPPSFYNPWEGTSQGYTFGAPQVEEEEEEDEEEEEEEEEEVDVNDDDDDDDDEDDDDEEDDDEDDE